MSSLLNSFRSCPPCRPSMNCARNGWRIDVHSSHATLELTLRRSSPLYPNNFFDFIYCLCDLPECYTYPNYNGQCPEQTGQVQVWCWQSLAFRSAPTERRASPSRRWRLTPNHRRNMDSRATCSNELKGRPRFPTRTLSSGARLLLMLLHSSLDPRRP